MFGPNRKQYAVSRSAGRLERDLPGKSFTSTLRSTVLQEVSNQTNPVRYASQLGGVILLQSPLRQPLPSATDGSGGEYHDTLVWQAPAGVAVGREAFLFFFFFLQATLLYSGLTELK
jgi:hypothetical protein